MAEPYQVTSEEGARAYLAGVLAILDETEAVVASLGEQLSLLQKDLADTRRIAPEMCERYITGLKEKGRS